MAVVIQIASGKAEVRPSYLVYAGVADNAARGDLGAHTAVKIRGALVVQPVFVMFRMAPRCVDQGLMVARRSSIATIRP